MYLLVGVIVITVVLLIVKNRMSVVKSDLDERAEAFKDVCQVKGSGQICASSFTCDNMAGINLGSEGWQDCKPPEDVCCQV